MLVNSNYRYGGGGIGSSLIIEGYYNDSKFYQDNSFTTEIDGESGKLYVDLSTNKTYRWTGSIFTAFNADTLDGLHASDFCNANSPRITGAIRVNPNTEGNFSEGIRIANATNGYSDIVLGAEGDAGITSTGIYIGKTATNEFVIARGASGDSSNGSLRLDTGGNWNVNGSNQLIHSGNIGSQSVANAATAHQVISPSSKVKLYENNEGGNLELMGPDGVHLMQMDLYNNESFRMYFYDGEKLSFPLSFDFSSQKLNINGNAETATSASNATTAITATKLSTSAGSVTQPVYFSDGKPVACTYTLGKSVPADAVFTDTVPTSVNYATNAGNADTVDGMHAWNLSTLSANGDSHGTTYPMYCRFNVLGDNRFYIGVGNGYERSVAVAFAEKASIAYSTSIATTANTAMTSHILKSFLIGTTNADYATILEWANDKSGFACASIVTGNGIPSDAPTQDEAMLRLESDSYGARKIVTWTKYGGGTPVIYQRAIFTGSWLDAGWERVK